MTKDKILKKIYYAVAILILVGFLICPSFILNRQYVNADSINTLEVDTYQELIEALETADSNSEIIITQKIDLPDGANLNGNGAMLRVVAPLICEDGVIRPTNPSEYNLFKINSNCSVTISNMTIIGGKIGENDTGAIYNQGLLEMENVTITRSYRGLNNNSGIVVMKDCNIVRNVCSYAAGILCAGGKIIMDGCSLSENYTIGQGLKGGGAIEIKNEGELYINNSVIINNSSGEIGGAINCYKSKIWMMNCTVSGNVTTGENRGYNGGGIGLNGHANAVVGGAFYAVNSIIADNYNIYGENKVRSDIGCYSDIAANCIINCVYGDIVRKSGVGALTINEESKQDLTSSFAAKYRNDGVLIQDCSKTINFLHPAAVTKAGNISSLYVPAKLGNSASSGGVQTYFDYSNVNDVKMGYGEPDSIIQLGNLTAPTSDDEVKTYYEGGTRSLGIIGASHVTDANYYIVTLSSNFQHGSVSGATVYGDCYLEGTEVTVYANSNNGYKLKYWVCCKDSIFDISNITYISPNNPFKFNVVDDVVILPIFVDSQDADIIADETPSVVDPQIPDEQDAVTPVQQGLPLWIVILIVVLSLLVVVLSTLLFITYRRMLNLKVKNNTLGTSEEKSTEQL